MIFAHARLVKEVRQAGHDATVHKRMLQQRVNVFGYVLHRKFGSVGLLLGGAAAGIAVGLLMSPVRLLRTGGRLSLSLLKLVPWVNAAVSSVSVLGRDIGR